jgi:tRNA A-37 threonylcarbamoyl transferase component Bud32
MFSAARDVSRGRLQPGTRIGQHLVIRSVLGQGGTAVVYEAEHTRLGSTVAVKVAHVHASVAEDAAARLEREARVCANLNDRRVPRVFDVGELDDGTPYLVMEKVSGTTLEDLLARNRMKPSVALGIARELLFALEAVHRAGVVHRDVKPSNVLVQLDDEGAHVHLMDFGVSKPIAARRTDPGITRPGAVVGTPLYMAPEQLSAEELDQRTDLYAVGVLLYEMLAGRSPFVGDSTAEVVSAILTREHAPLSTAWAEAPPEVASLVARAMAESAAERFFSAREMREALDEAWRAMQAPAALRTSYYHPGPQAVRRAIWTGLVFGAAVALALPLVRGPRFPTAAAELPPAAAAVVTQAPEPAQEVGPVPQLDAAPLAARPAPAAIRPASKQPALKAPALKRPPARPAVRPLPPRAAMARPKARALARPAARPAPHPAVGPRTAAPHAGSMLNDSLRELEGLRGTISAPDSTPSD